MYYVRAVYFPLQIVVSYSVRHVFLKSRPPTGIYTLSLHDALPIWSPRSRSTGWRASPGSSGTSRSAARTPGEARSEEHTSELQSRQYLVCRLLLEKKNDDIEQLLKSSASNDV